MGAAAATEAVRLKSGRSLHAFTCFEKVIPSFSKSPKLWIRLAECCIQYNQKPDQATEDLLVVQRVPPWDRATQCPSRKSELAIWEA